MSSRKVERDSKGRLKKGVQLNPKGRTLARQELTGPDGKDLFKDIKFEFGD